MPPLLHNDYGYFSEDFREFVITRPDTPAPWVNYIWNQNYQALVSHVGGGFSFLQDPRDNRVLRFRYNNMPWDQPGRYVYLRDEKDFWSLAWCPTQNLKYDFYEARHGQGYTKISTERRGLRGEITYFVPREDPLECWQVRLENKTRELKSLQIFAYAELCLGNALNDLINQPNDKHFSDVRYRPDWRGQRATRNYWKNNRGVSVEQPNQDWPLVVFFASTSAEAPIGFDGGKDQFIGRWRSEANPEAVERGLCFNSEITHGDPCVALEYVITLEPGESKTFTMLLGAADKTHAETQVPELLARYRQPGAVESALAEVKKYWDIHLGALRVETPDPAFNAMINVWNRYQTAVTFDMARNAGYYHGGLLFGTGVRDQCQDLLGPLLAEPERVRERIAEVASYQFADGSILHNFFRLSRYGERTGHSDTPLWLPFAIMNYLKETGDFAFLDRVVPFYDHGEGAMRLHFTQALDYVIGQLTERNLPKFGPGDWNDTLDYVGRQGKGETMWGAGFLCYLLREAETLFNYINEKATASRYRRVYEKVKTSVNELAWDGAWYVRGFKDNGEAFGSQQNREGKIFIEPQPWAVLSGIAEGERAARTLQSVREKLDTPFGPQLVFPAYRTVDTNIGLATRCVPGKKENGAVFNHAASWYVCAELLHGDSERGWQTYRKMMPINSSANATPDRYKVEPYVYAEYLTSPEHPTAGEASHSWLTGSAVWMLRNGTDALLGLQPTYDGLRLQPHLPREWQRVRLHRVFRGTTYEIEIAQSREFKENELLVNGEPWRQETLPLRPGATVRVQLRLVLA